MKMKRVLSLLLALVMTLSLLTLPSYAEDEDTAEETTSVEAVTSAEDDFSALTVAEQYAALMAMEDEAAAQAAYDSLTAEQQNELTEYVAAQMEPVEQEEYTVPQTVVFTDAGPFMPAVNVAPARKLMKAAPMKAPKTDDNGVEFTKKATLNPDGKSYTITMEAWATGTSVTTTSTKPVDIVLVLDQSGSMAYDFNGNSTSTNSNRRQYAMKQAVNNFIDAVNEKYTEDGDHRMAIVTFGSSASTLQGWTAVDDDNFGTLHDAINGLSATPSGGTQTGLGMAQAETLMGSGYNYNGSNTDRQKVVILFTDGVPGQSGFDTSVATSAIASAKNLKDSGVTVYSIGIFNGANPDQLHGDAVVTAYYGDYPCLGNINEIWGGTSWGKSSSGNDFQDEDIAAGNRFLNYLSSNYSKASSIGIESGRYDKTDVQGYKWTAIEIVWPWLQKVSGYKITKNYDRTGNGYYLSAADTASLNTIFQTISQQIDTASTTLDSKAVVKDTISPYFEAPAGSDIKLYTAPYNGTEFSTTRQAATGVTATLNNGVVSVTDFDFAKEFVSDTKKSDNTYGKKLIIEFTVSPKDGFLGGNNVPTNGEAAIYDKEGGTKVEEVSSPVVDVEIPKVTVTAVDKNVYLTNSLTKDQLLAGATIKCGDVSLDQSKTNYGLESWQNKYVDINIDVKENGSIVSDKLENLTANTTYTITATVAPQVNPTQDNTKSGTSPAANVYVYKPVLTFKDSEVYYGATAPAQADYGNNDLVKPIEWKNGDTTAPASMGPAPDLTLTYTPQTDSIAGNKIVTKNDIPVDVTAKIGNTDVTGDTTFKHQDCTTGESIPNNAEFVLHVKTCTLTVKKSGWQTIDENQSFIFNVTGGAIAQDIKATVQGNGEVTIVGLPVGKYTVNEDGNWSWRYAAAEGSATLSAADHNKTVTINNTRNNPSYWLSGDSYAINTVNTNAGGNVAH